MSQFTDYAENKIADFFRGEGITLPTNWTVIPGSAGSDSGVTEITGLGIVPATVARSLVKWKSTQDDSIASTGTSKLTSNTDAISFGTPSGSGTLTHVGIKDATNVWVWVEVENVAFTAGDPDPLQLDAGALRFKLGQIGGATHYLVNKFIDLFFRGQAFTWPATLGLSYFTTAPTDSGGGVEASGGSYARIALVPDLVTISSTQGNTSASTGTGGRISNLGTMTHPAPSADQGTALAIGTHDATTAGNLLFWKDLDSPISIVTDGPAPFYAPDTWAITIA
jgi:hypothetical protein